MPLRPLTPRPQIMKSDVQKYNKCMSVCQQRVNASLHLRYFANLRSNDDNRHTIFHSISGT